MPASRYKVPPPALRLLERYRASRLSCRQLHIRKQVKETTGSHDQAAGGEKSKGGRGSKQDVQWVDLQVKGCICLWRDCNHAQTASPLHSPIGMCKLGFAALFSLSSQGAGIGHASVYAVGTLHNPTLNLRHSTGQLERAWGSCPQFRVCVLDTCMPCIETAALQLIVLLLAQKSLLVVEPDLDCPSDEDWHCLPGQAHYRDFVLSSDPKLLTPGFKIQCKSSCHAVACSLEGHLIMNLLSN